MNYRTLKDAEGRIYVEKALMLESSGADSKSMSRRIAKVIANMNTTNMNANIVNFVRAKRILHEVLLDHYVVPQDNVNPLPENLENGNNVVIRYRTLQYDFIVSVTMAVDGDCYSFHLDNLDTEDTKLITFSNTDVECFVDRTNINIKKREEKFDELHTRIRHFLLGKETGSRNETPIMDPNEEPDYPAWWNNV